MKNSQARTGHQCGMGVDGGGGVVCVCVWGRGLPVEWDCGSENKKKNGREDVHAACHQPPMHVGTSDAALPKRRHACQGGGGTARLVFFSGPESSWKHPDHHPKRTVPPYPRPVQTTSCTPVPIWLGLLLRAALPRGAGAGSWRRRSAPHRACLDARIP